MAQSLEVLLKSATAEQLLKSKPEYCGWLCKKNQRGKTQRRYCILLGGNFFYFENNKSKTARNGFNLNGYRAYKVQDQGYSTTVVVKYYRPGKRIYVFEAASEREQEDWIEKINATVRLKYSESLRIKPVDEIDDPKYEDINEIKQKVHFFFSEDERYVRMTNVREMKGNFVGPKTSTSKPPPGLPQRKPMLPKRITDDTDDIYDKIADDDVINSYRTVTDGRYVERVTGEDDSYVRIKDSCHVNKEDEHYVVMNNNEETVYEPMTACQPSDTDIEPYMNNDELYVPLREYDVPNPNPNSYDFPKVSSKKLGSPNAIKRRVSSPERPLPLPPLPPARTGSLLVHSNAASKSINDLPDHVILPLSVYQKGMQKHESTTVLHNFGIIGSYLIRTDREDGRNALAVLTGKDGDVKHYIIFTANQKIYLKKGEPEFSNTANLVRHYYENDLPHCNIRLTKPYR